MTVHSSSCGTDGGAGLAIISNNKNALTTKDILINYFSSMVTELAQEINFNASYIEKLANNIAQIIPNHVAGGLHDTSFPDSDEMGHK